MRSAKRLSIFAIDEPEPLTPQTSSSLRVLKKSYQQTSLDSCRVMRMTPQTSHSTQYQDSPDDISDQPLSKQLFIAETNSISERKNYSLFKMIIESSTNPRKPHNSYATCSPVTYIDRTGLEQDMAYKSQHRSPQSLFDELLLKQKHSPTKILFPESEYSYENRKRTTESESNRVFSQFLSGTIDVRGTRKLIETLNISLRSLEKENSKLRVKVVEYQIAELKR